MNAAQEKAQAPRLPLAERIQAQRKEMFKAMAIIDCCRFGSDSMLGGEDEDRPDIATALSGVYDMLNTAASELGVIAESCPKGKTAKTAEQP